MNLTEKKIQFQDFKVIKEQGNEEDFFRLETQQGEVRLPKMQFQKNRPLPDTLNCRIKGYSDSKPILGHNMPRYVSEFYADGFSKGQEFEFKVVGRPYENNGFYRLEDENGLQFKLQELNTTFAYGQSVKCRFEYLDPNVYILRRSGSDSDLKMLTLRDLGRILGIKSWAVEKLDRQLREYPEFEYAINELDHGRPAWIFSALRTVKTLLPKWFGENLSTKAYDYVRSALDGYRKIAMYLLEGSGFLRNIKGMERSNMQADLTRQIEQIDIYEKALDIIVNNQQDQFINSLLDNLKESGYIFHPNTQFAIMMILFKMSPQLINKSLGNIFDTLMEWYPDTWKAEPFRQAFVEQLEIFIAQTREEIDDFLRPETPIENEKIEKLLRAIAIQHSLATKDDSIDSRLNMSLFYRCLSLLRQAKADTLIHKSLLTLMGATLPTDFNWNDIKEPTMMMTRGAVDAPDNAALPSNPRFYISENAEIEFNGKGFSIYSSKEDAANVCYNGMFPWPEEIQVNVNTEHSFSRSKYKSLDGHADFWNEVETALFNKKKEETHTIVQRMPDVDDTVCIMIDRVVTAPNDPARAKGFICKSCDKYFLECEGILDAEDLIGYNLHGISIGTFRNDNGQPLIFEAVVKEIDENDKIHFSLIDKVKTAIRDIAKTGDKCLAVITKDNDRSYTAICEKGFGIYVNKDPDDHLPYHCGNVVMVQITQCTNDIIQSTIIDGPLDGFTVNNAKSLQNLLRYIAVRDEDNMQELELDEEDLIPREHLSELVQILRYKAISKDDDIIMAYDYLSIARIIAKIIEDDYWANIIKAHKDILMQHQHYAKNKSIYREDVESISQTAPNSPLIKNLSEKLLIISSLGQSDYNTYLWDLANHSVKEAERELASTVLSYNLLYQLNHEDATAAAIKNNIAEMLNVNSEQRNLKYYGSENQYVEFKSSLVYPARKEKKGISDADPDRQEYEIMHIIAGFMNTTGGTLYIGVNDDHYERGLESDFNFYKLPSDKNTSFRHAIKNLDNMANYLQNLIDKSFSIGSNAGDYAKVFIDDESTKGVLMVKVDPCPHIVYFDGKIFKRHSGITRPLLDKTEIDQFIADRQTIYQNQNQILSSQPTIDVPSKPAAATTSESLEVDSEPIEKKRTNSELATSTLRKNILHDYIDPDAFVRPSFYIRFTDDSNYIITKDEWSLDEENDRLDLIITADEEDHHLLLVYEDEFAIKVPIRELTSKKINQPHSHYSEKKLLFATPIKSGEGLYSLHANSKNVIYERFTPIEEIEHGSMGSAPSRILEVDCAKSPFWEVVPSKDATMFSDINSASLKRAQLGSLVKGFATIKATEEEAITAFYDKIK